MPGPLQLLFLVLCPLQAGDVAGEEQPPLPARLALPPAPALSARDQARTFALEPGLEIELVASEPLVVDPVQIAFDERGRLWVCEMRGYMPDADGNGEREPVGTIAVLEDTDGDGRMDRRTTFLDGLVLPRAVAPTRGGALVLAPPELLFWRDTDGDGRADERTLIDTGLAGIESPEHAINGLVLSLEGDLLVANAAWRYRFVPLALGGWVRVPDGGGGQWGITRDDLGRVLFNTNPDPVRGDLFASTYAIRNGAHGRAAGVNVRLAHDFAVWPARPTPGVNRGYRAETLRADGTLASFTAACAPWVVRGGGLGASLRGNVLVCEPSANLIKRYVLEEEGPGLVARATSAGREFLTSTDERFRPVGLSEGPDGCVYVADLYRGVLQHRIFMTSFLRAQVEARGLEQPPGLGRIWRLRASAARPADAREPAPSPALHQATWTELAEALAHPDGWWRDTAQRLFLEEGPDDDVASEVLSDFLAHTDSALGRIHALWCLAALGSLDLDQVERNLAHPDPRVAHAAVRVSEPWLATRDSPLVARLVELAGGGDLRLRRQVLLSLGQARSSSADRALLQLAAQDVSQADTRSAILSGLSGRAAGCLNAVFADEAWRVEAEGRGSFVQLLARAATREAGAVQLEALVSLASQRASGSAPWQGKALIAGLLAGRAQGPGGAPAPLHLTREPANFAQLQGLEGTAGELAASLTWPGRVGGPRLPEVRPLTESERARFDRGSSIYASVCAACHQPSGLGEAGKGPRLRGSPYVLGSSERLASILLHGLSGPLELDGETWDMEMPALAASDAELAAVMTYLRREWGHGAQPVTGTDVEALRRTLSGRRRPWTVAELPD